MSINFKRKKEDFTCEKCGVSVAGDGYTNHCSKCLYSKHVDYTPGDRENMCGGLMRPIGAEKRGEIYVITHKCDLCGEEKKNKSASSDDFDTLISLC